MEGRGEVLVTICLSVCPMGRPSRVCFYYLWISFFFVVLLAFSAQRVLPVSDWSHGTVSHFESSVLLSHFIVLITICNPNTYYDHPSPRFDGTLTSSFPGSLLFSRMHTFTNSTHSTQGIHISHGISFPFFSLRKHCSSFSILSHCPFRFLFDRNVHTPIVAPLLQYIEQILSYRPL